MNFDLYTVAHNAPFQTAFQKIEDNRKCFLIAMKEKRVVGTITDGDFRRAFLRGTSINGTIEEVYNRDFDYLQIEKETVADAIEHFQRGNYKFLPVLDASGSFVNIVTKDSLEWITLQSKMVDLHYDFLSVDDMCTVREIHIRPWGFYKTTVLNDYFQSKIIHLNPRASLSLQKHKRREEYWIIVHGEGKAILEDSVKYVSGGTTLFIPKGCKHRLVNTSEIESLVLTEVQLGDYFGEDDIIRYEDIYGRSIVKE